MENNNMIQVFENSEFGKVRTTVIDGEPWFVAVDVCKALDINNGRQAMTRLDEDEKGVISSDTLGGRQNLTSINESGLYTLVLSSRKPEAKKFKRWITHEVVPAIRKTGGYIMGEETMSDDELLARALIMAQKKIELRDKELKEKNELLELQKPKVEFADHVAASKNSIDMGDFAKLAQKNGIELGRNRLFATLRKMGILMKDNIPYQQYMDLGWFEVVEMPYIKNGEVYTTFKTLVTGKGQSSIIKKLKKCII